MAIGIGLLLVALSPATAAGAWITTWPAGAVSATGAFSGVGSSTFSCRALTLELEMLQTVPVEEVGLTKVGDVDGAVATGCSNDLWFLTFDWAMGLAAPIPTDADDPLIVTILIARIEVDYVFNCLYRGFIRAVFEDDDGDADYEELLIQEQRLTLVSGFWCDPSIAVSGRLRLTPQQILTYYP